MGIEPPKPGRFSQWISTRKAKPPEPPPKPLVPPPTSSNAREDQIKEMADEIRRAWEAKEKPKKDPGT